MVYTTFRPMTRIFDIQSQIPLLRKMQPSLDMTGIGGVDHIDWVITNAAAVLLRMHISRDASSIRIDWIAAVVGPDWIIDADWV